jgi:hypothetical protein
MNVHKNKENLKHKTLAKLISSAIKKTNREIKLKTFDMLKKRVEIGHKVAKMLKSNTRRSKA